MSFTLDKTAVFYIFLGGVVYTVLNWIPLVGAFLVGLLVSRGFDKNIRESFIGGALSGLLGSFIVFYLILSNEILSLSGEAIVLSGFILWTLLVWNIISVILVGVGSSIGSFGRGLAGFLPPEWFDSKADKYTEYRICSGCSRGNPSNASVCVFCGGEL
jgi:hypothetical protein